MVLNCKITLNGSLPLDYVELSEPSILRLGERAPHKITKGMQPVSSRWSSGRHKDGETEI